MVLLWGLDVVTIRTRGAGIIGSLSKAGYPRWLMHMAAFGAHYCLGAQ